MGESLTRLFQLAFHNLIFDLRGEKSFYAIVSQQVGILLLEDL